MTTPTDPPEWALEEANKLLKWSRYRSQSQWREKIALALDAARRRGIEEAAQVANIAGNVARVNAFREESTMAMRIALRIRAFTNKELT